MTVVGRDPHIEVDVTDEDRHRPRAIRIGGVADAAQIGPRLRRYVVEVPACGPPRHSGPPAQLSSRDVGEHDVRSRGLRGEPEAVLALRAGEPDAVLTGGP